MKKLSTNLVALVLILLATFGNNYYVTVVMAANVLVHRTYYEQNTCDGIPTMTWSGVENQCIQAGPTSWRYTCSSYQYFTNPGCSGQPTSTGTYRSECQKSSFQSSLIQCETYPNEAIYLLETGNRCTVDGKVEGKTGADMLVVLNVCRPAGTSDSFRYTLTSEGIETAVFSNGDCSGSGFTSVLEVGTCIVTYQNGTLRTVMKYSPGVAPTPAPTTPPPTEPPTTSPSKSPTTEVPTESPTQSPTESPITETPTESPTTETPTESPITEAPTESPTTETPTESPITEAPTESSEDDDDNNPGNNSTGSGAMAGSSASGIVSIIATMIGVLATIF